MGFVGFSKAGATQIAKFKHGVNMGPTWVLSAPDGPHVGLMKLAIRAPSAMWVGLTCLNNPIFSTLGLCAACWTHFICHHELWPTSVSHPFSSLNSSPDSKVHGANMGPIWGRQDPGGPHVSPMNLVIWVFKSYWWNILPENYCP